MSYFPWEMIPSPPAGMLSWFDTLWGPTTLHLKHEAYLLASLTLLTAASLQNVYRETFGLRGDLIFCSLVALWLGRYIFLRWLVADRSTNASPDVRGVLAHWVFSHVTAGQYMDRPSSQVLAKQGIGSSRVEDDKRAAAQTAFVLPSILYTAQFFKIWVWFPLCNYRDRWHRNGHRGGLRGSRTRKSSDSESQPNYRRKGDHREVPPFWNKFLLFWNKSCNRVGPTLQMIIPVYALAYYAWSLPIGHYVFTPKSADASESKPFGAYTTTQPPPWTHVFFYISTTTMLSLLFFSRLVLPIPDLVAGSNVVKAVRSEAKALGKPAVSHPSVYRRLVHCTV